MRTGFARPLLGTTALVVLSSATPATAQDEGTSHNVVSEIVVTARRVEERLQDVPISITVFNQQQLADRNIFNGGDLASYTPSLSTNSRFGSEKSTFAIRGFTQEISTSPSVGVYFADVVAPRANGLQPGGNGAGVGSFFDLQNVQVLRGPQGTLFGRNTTGGAILLVPKRPTDQYEGYVEGSIGNHDLIRGQAVFNAPFSDTVRVRFGIDSNQRQGYLQNHSGSGPNDFADVNYIAFRGSVVVDLSPRLENYLIASYSDSDTNGTLARLIACQRVSPALGPLARTGPLACAQLDRQAARGDGFYDVESNIRNPRQHLRQWQAINTTTWTATDALTIKNIVSYAEFRDSSTTNAFGDNWPNSSDGRNYSFIVFSPGPSGNVAAQSTLTEELQFQGSGFEDRLDWQAGAYLELSDPLGRNTQYTQTFVSCTDVYAFLCKPLTAPVLVNGSTVMAPIGSVSAPSQTTSFRNLGIYAQGTYKLTDKVSLTTGLRYTDDRTRGTGENVSVRFLSENNATFSCTKTPSITFPNAASIDRSRCSTAYVEESRRPTWLIDLDYMPIEDVLLYAKYARGYRQGNVNANVTGFETWGPEKVNTYEVGAKTSFSSAVQGIFNIAGFYNDFSDQQLQASLTAVPGSGAPGNAIVNAGKSRMWGIEADASARLFDDFRIDLSYGYLNTEVKELTLPTFDPRYYTAIFPTAAVGDPLTLAPKTKYSVTGTYALPLKASIGEMSLSATFSHTGQQLATRGTAIAANQYLPATDLLNLNFNWNSVGEQPIDLSLFATNLTNEEYRTSVSAAFNAAGFDTVIIGEPRMYGMRVRYRFGG